LTAIDHIDRVHTDVGCLRPLPKVAYGALLAIHDGELSIDNLLALIAQDPDLEARLLRSIRRENPDLPARVASLVGTVSYIGVPEIVHWTVASCFAPYFRDVDAGYGLERGAVWRHGLACGLAAEMLAERCGCTARAAAFTAGLLHDLGKVALSPYLANAADAVRHHAANGAENTLELEHAILGLDHTAAGSLIANRWLLPAPLRLVLRQHHATNTAAGSDALTLLVRIADSLCSRIGVADGDAGSPCPAALADLGLSEDEVDAVGHATLEELDRCAALVALPWAIAD
jgi:HD-like signal output (HDOD) protein